MELEQLACNGMAPVDFEHTLFQALVNEGKHIRVIDEHFSSPTSLRPYPLNNLFLLWFDFSTRFHSQVLNAKRPQFTYNGKYSVIFM